VQIGDELRPSEQLRQLRDIRRTRAGLSHEQSVKMDTLLITYFVSNACPQKNLLASVRGTHCNAVLYRLLMAVAVPFGWRALAVR
jgi:hypothetical protein